MRLPPEGELRRQVLDALIDERVIITSARESGMRVDEPEIDRAVQSIAAQNQISLDTAAPAPGARKAWTTRASAPTCATR